MKYSSSIRQGQIQQEDADNKIQQEIFEDATAFMPEKQRIFVPIKCNPEASQSPLQTHLMSRYNEYSHVEYKRYTIQALEIVI